MDLVVRAAFVYLLILAVTRVIGRRELSSLQPFDLILLVVIGDLVQQGVTQNDLSITGTVIVLATIVALQVATSYVSFRFRRMRPILDGEPIVLVEDGRVIEPNMRRERITIEDIAEEARQDGIGSLEEIRWAVLETSGGMSFIKKDPTVG